MSKLASIDFEYANSSEEKLDLVCCSIKTKEKGVEEFWLSRKDYGPLKERIEELNRDDYVFLSYAVMAEASSFISMGLDPLKFKWIDLYLEYRCLSNHNDNYMYGKQYSNGKKRFTSRPKKKWERKTEDDEKKADASKPSYGLSSAVYKTLGVVIDTDHKTAMRNLIISNPEEGFSKEEKKAILSYCSDDVKYLAPMFKEMLGEYKRLLKEDFNMNELKKEIYWRSEFACRSAIMERDGYPINVEATRNLSNQVPNLIWECQYDINKQFGDVNLFRAKVKRKPFNLSMNEKVVRGMVQEWINKNNYKGWILTEGKALSLSLKAFKKAMSYSHFYPKGNFLAQMQRYLSLKQGLNGFVSNNTKSKKFWDSVGKDGRVRPFMGIYGAQSARSQPSATGFIPLKAAWMRVLIEPPKGSYICGIDYSSQEYLISALFSNDTNMLKAYASGDVYLAYGKDIGYIPKHATKATHKKERDDCKAVVLGLSYDMSEYGLARNLTEKFNRPVSPEEALTWINKHKIAYRNLWRKKEEVGRKYRLKKRIKLPDGWYLWGDNDNFRSVGNVPIQGFASGIMRKAVQLAQDEGLKVIYTLHDALYIEAKIGSTKPIQTLARCMDEAFRFYFPSELQNIADVRMDADIWSSEFKETKQFSIGYSNRGKSFNLPISQKIKYIDPRGKEEYEKFKNYLKEESYENVEF